MKMANVNAVFKSNGNGNANATAEPAGLKKKLN
jgi:hypothetical protein